jgi:hypothetical protein
MGGNSSNFDNYEDDYHGNNDYQNGLTLEQLNKEFLALKAKLEDESSNYVTKADYNREKIELFNQILELKKQLGDKYTT